ncbi:hypothetical protein ENKNEFLB_01953 [Nocardioides aquaticus]|uniref:Uncharacterized protein n=2 Tax=Actinomycetes TaxID=1760 RepID=A0ABP4DVN6_9ACTN|nr:hypothetical protein [Nocardioides aquaticus]QVT79570.1 hypothetical protein ENKNEFLB_01953 [Nocardioides aquaticus]
MSGLPDAVLGGTTLAIQPLGLRVRQTYSTGATSDVYVREDNDLGVIKKSEAAMALRNAEGGQVVIALAVDGESDHVYFHGDCGADTDAVETLRCAVEALTAALAAAERTVSA